MSEVLRLENVCKSFGHRPVVKNVSFAVGEGEIFGFLGPNGAGKTTTIKMVLGLLAADSGTILVKAPLSFGSEGYIAFDDDTSPNFLGYELTPTEFMETDFTQSDDEDMDEDEDETQIIQMGGISQ